MKKFAALILLALPHLSYATTPQEIAKVVARCAGNFLVTKMVHEANKDPAGAKYYNTRAVAFLEQSYGVLGQQQTNAIAKSVIDYETKNFNDNVPGTSARVSKIVKTCEDLGKEAGF